MSDEVKTGEIVERKPGALRRTQKREQLQDTTGDRRTLQVRQALIEAAGYTPDDLARARQAKVDALDALDRRGSADHITRLKAAAAIDDVLLPQVHGNSHAAGKSVLELDLAPWLRKRLESKGSQ